MSTRNITIVLVLILSFFGSNLLQAQGFAEIYQFGQPVRGESLVRDNDGDFYIAVHEFFSTDMLNGIIKTDAVGDTIWTRHYPELDTLTGIRMHMTDDENIIMAGASGAFGGGDFLAAKLNRQTGDIIWQTTAPGSQLLNYIYDSYIDDEGSIYLLGTCGQFGSDGSNMVKFSSTGEVLWYFEYITSSKAKLQSFVMNDEGNLTVAGSLNFINGQNNIYLTLSPTTGEILTNLEVAYQTDYRMYTPQLEVGTDGTIRAIGLYQPEGEDGVQGIMEIENDGTEIIFMPFDETDNEIGRFQVLENGDFLEASSGGNVPKLARYNAQAELIWAREYRDINVFDNVNMWRAVAFQGGFAFTGNALGPGFHAYLAVTDGDGYLYSNEISGSAFWDENLDCALTNDEMLLAGRQVKFSSSERDYYRYTDENGDYSIVLDTGIYTVNVLPHNELWTNCAAQEVTFTDFFSTSDNIDLPLQVDQECALLSTNILTNRLRRCIDNSYFVSYQNNGTIDGENVYLEVQIDAELSVVSSNPPFTSQEGNLLTYDIGTLAPFESGSINITVFVPCDGDVELGMTHCSQAEIFPQTDCFTPTWSGASIEVRGTCTDDEGVYFEIENVGDSAMESPLEFIVIEDEMILNQGPFDLNPGEIFPIELPATGNSFITFAEQEPGHPGFSMPTAYVDGCGGFNGQSTVTWFPSNDNDDFVDIDCHENVDSYDPNDKTANPRGFGDEHFIEPNTDISYLIRFQNEGNDTAYQVVVKDTLTSLLDVSTIKLEGSSFPYELEIRSLEDDHELTFIFNNINLLPKAWDEAASQGFLKYKIKQQVDLPLGTVIENRAGIYFDFNAPIITNTAFHTLGVDFVEIVNAVQFVDNELLSLNVSPNPVSAEAIISIAGQEVNGQVELHDLTGKILKTLILENGEATLRRGDLADGFYVLKVVSEGKIIGTGKIVLR